MSAREERKAKNMRLLCEIGGLALVGLLILFLVIDIAVIRVGKTAGKRTIRVVIGQSERKIK